jgi:hypothetical protein
MALDYLAAGAALAWPWLGTGLACMVLAWFGLFSANIWFVLAHAGIASGWWVPILVLRWCGTGVAPMGSWR